MIGNIIGNIKSLMKNLKIGIKIFLSFGVVIFMMFAITATVLITNLQTMRNISDADADTSLQSLVVALQTQFMQARIQAEILSLKYTEDAYSEYEACIKSAMSICESIYELIDSKPSLEHMRQSISSLESEMSAWDNSVNEIRDVNLQCAESQKKALKAELVLNSCVEYLMKYLRNDITLEIYLNDLERMDNISKWVEYTFDMEIIIRGIYSICMSTRETMLVFNSEGAAENAQALQDAIDKINALEVISLKTDVVVKELVTQLQAYRDSYLLFAKDGGTLISALEITRQSGAKAVASMNELLLSVDDTVNAQMADTTRLANTALVIVAAVSLMAFVVAALMAALINSGITKPMRILSDVLLQIGSKGDLQLSPELTEQINIIAAGKDEIAVAIDHMAQMNDRLMTVGSQLGKVAAGDLTAKLTLLSENDTMGLALNKMIISLNYMFHDINNSAVHVTAGSRQIADSAQALALGSTDQASAIEQLSGSISEIAEETKDNAEQAVKAAHLSDTVRKSAERGAEQMQEMMRAVREINDASGNISRVIKVIDDIAFQTNILALNAAVEAARAGQHGKGFAVVAEEVRSLAAKSAAAAGNTGQLISNSMEKARLGARIAEDTSASLGEIVAGINKTSEIVSRIAKSSEQQSRAIEHINGGIDQVTRVVQQNSVTAEESASTSEKLSEQSDLLNGLMKQFKLSDLYETPRLGS